MYYLYFMKAKFFFKGSLFRFTGRCCSFFLFFFFFLTSFCENLSIPLIPNVRQAAGCLLKKKTGKISFAKILLNVPTHKVTVEFTIAFHPVNSLTTVYSTHDEIH